MHDLCNSYNLIIFICFVQKLRIFSCWEGFKCFKDETEKPWFGVRRDHTIFSRDYSCRVILKCDGIRTSYCRIIGLEGKSSLKIVDFSGQLLAEVLLYIIYIHVCIVLMRSCFYWFRVLCVCRLHKSNHQKEFGWEKM